MLDGFLQGCGFGFAVLLFFTIRNFFSLPKDHSAEATRLLAERNELDEQKILVISRIGAILKEISDHQKLPSKISEKLKEIVCTEGCDKGVVMLSSEGPVHYDEELKGQVYDHEFFSPLGDALIEIYHMVAKES